MKGLGQDAIAGECRTDFQFVPELSWLVMLGWEEPLAQMSSFETTCKLWTGRPLSPQLLDNQVLQLS